MSKDIAYCGLRPIEVRNLKWADLDFTNDLLTVTKSKTAAGTGRKLPIPPQLKTALLEHKLKGQNDEWVFVRYKNNTLPLDENSFYHAWHNFCREMDIANGATVYRNQITKSTLSLILSLIFSAILSAQIAKQRECR